MRGRKRQRHERAYRLFRIEKHISDEVGGWDTTIRREEYEKLFYNQQATMEAPAFDEEVAAAAAVSASFSEEEDSFEEETETELTETNAAHPAVYTTIAEEKPEEQMPAFDLSTLAEGDIVLHAKFGEGKIVKLDKSGKYIHVAFSVGEKTFAVSAFEQGFLKLKK